MKEHRQCRPAWSTWPSYAATITRLGYSARDIGEASDQLVNAIVAQGNPAVIGAKAREHVAAAADHVMLLLSTGSDFANGVDRLEEIASAFPA